MSLKNSSFSTIKYLDDYLESLIPEKTYQKWVQAGLKLGSHALTKTPERFLDMAFNKALSRFIAFPEGVEFLSKMIKVFKHKYPQLHPNVRDKFLNNLIGNIFILNTEKRRKVLETLGTVPMLMVISPTMRCNLQCTGCYSANYNKNDVLDTAMLDDIFHQAKELSIHFVVVSGGEPYIRKDLLPLFERHSDIMFMTYTNSTIIHDRNLVPELARLGNVMPALSVEGFEKETDQRRGPGVYTKIINTMNQLQENGVLFGFSATPMRHNNELLVSDEFVEFYQNLGAFFGWYFSYMPIGRKPDLSLMPTPKQREHRYNRMRDLRKNHPNIVVSDFWCDGALTGGCISGGRSYFHINADGGMEPCVFNQFYVDKVQDKSLLDILKSDYFTFFRKKIKANPNPLTPCPIIDKPEILREAYHTYQPKPSQSGGDDLIHEHAAQLDEYSRELAQIFNPIWERDKKPGYRTQARKRIKETV